MEPLQYLSPPLPPNQPPDGYRWEEYNMSVSSKTTAFVTGIDRRDSFLGKPRCVVCGAHFHQALEHALIIPQAEPETWSDLRGRGWIPEQAKLNPCHEARNGVLFCNYHHKLFDAFAFFIRFFPNIRKFVLVNYSDETSLQAFHGKAIALEITDHHAPFPSLFIIHEMRVRGFHPFAPLRPDMPINPAWQDWISSSGVFDNTTNSFIREQPSLNRNRDVTAQSQIPSTMANTGDMASDGGLAYDSNVIEEILAVTRAMPSWKACQVEGTPWTGTAEENIQKYISHIGV
ncbi:hypothetical protein D9615_004888 [Tricholomella constricta]|uniref:HNH nuclease domain-containing protein n=1 Tax=Tricholomella constricta TaxID=117010 RepID=A0A8H5HGB2_9AGAR|nr:hypothetical protein D9615_004888 [Tricholomella constricta]